MCATKDFAQSRRRAKQMTLDAAKAMAPQMAAPFTKVAKTRGNPLEDKKKRRADKARMEERLKEYKERRAHRGRKRPMTESQKRQYEERR